jgi:RimJ/RimL family protein N-acetyltransferase
MLNHSKQILKKGIMKLSKQLFFVTLILAANQSFYSLSVSVKVRSYKKILETDRVILREFVEEDCAELAPILADKEVMRYSINGPITFQETEARIKQYIKHYEDVGFGRWAVIDKKSNKLIGYCGISLTPPIYGECYWEIGYRMSREFWGKGLATEFVTAVKDYGFNTLKFSEIIAVIEPPNIASIKVIEKVGLKYWKQAHYYNMLVNVYKLEHPKDH